MVSNKQIQLHMYWAVKLSLWTTYGVTKHNRYIKKQHFNIFNIYKDNQRTLQTFLSIFRLQKTNSSCL